MILELIAIAAMGIPDERVADICIDVGQYLAMAVGEWGRICIRLLIAVDYNVLACPAILLAPVVLIRQILFELAHFIIKLLLSYHLMQIDTKSNNACLRSAWIIIPSFSRTVLRQPINGPIIFHPAYSNTHIVNCKYDYMEETVHFQHNGKVLKKQTNQACDSQIQMLSEFEVVFIRSIMKYNGNVSDFVTIWDLSDDSRIEFQYFPYYLEEDWTMSIKLVVFQKSKLICICQYQREQSTGATRTYLTYYEPIISQGQKSYKKCHSHSCDSTKLEPSQEALPTKLNEQSMIGLINLGGWVKKVELYVYHYQKDKDHKAGQIISIDLEGDNMKEQEKEIGLIQLLDIWEISSGKLYLKYEQDKKIRQSIWDYKQSLQRKVYHEQSINSTSNDTQFINNFHSPIGKNLNRRRYEIKNLVNPTNLSDLLQNKERRINVLYPLSDQYVIGGQVEVAVLNNLKRDSKGPKRQSIAYFNNQIVDYILGAQGDLVIKSTHFGELYFGPAEGAVWLATQLLGQGCDEDLLSQICSLIS